MSDPIPLLLSYMGGQLKATKDEANGLLLFGENGSEGKFRLTKRTRMVSDRGAGTPYTLNALWTLAAHRDEKYANYLRATDKANRVAFKDFTDLVKYFKGLTETIPQLSMLPLDTMDVDEPEDFAPTTEAPTALDVPLVLTPEEEMAKEALFTRLQNGEFSSPIPESSFRTKSNEIVDSVRALEQPLYTTSSVLSSGANFSQILRYLVSFKKQQAADQRSNQKKLVKEAHARSKATGGSRYDFSSKEVWRNAGVGDVSDLGISLGDNKGKAKPGASKRPRSKSSSSGPPTKKSRSSSSRPRGPPIIIVPTISLVTSFNIKDLLVNSMYVASKEAKEKSRKAGRPTDSHVYIMNPATKEQFEVKTNGKILRPSEWERVIGVIAQGQEWQFKGWKWALPADIFGKVNGFYFHFEDEAVPTNVRDWNVQKIQISKAGRHKDKAASLIFWGTIEKALRTDPEKWDQYRRSNA
eukprot:TRINITY_DN2201_c0_g1_i1.p1 TRINITY_DN2201_c0_g1~~TRINITY_DN2201_c0_g1_i1.p1  ORF type:complete len:486 (+),score=90.12 TRINITY_DN2201_c0_g1_i1:57-1460(+)